MPELIAQLAHELHCNVLMDDAPILTPPDVDVEGTGREVLDKVCDLYDYTWQVSRTGMVLLHKRFHDQNELPQMRLLELQQMARDVNTSLAGITCDLHYMGWVDSCQSLYATLTPEQKQAMQQGGSLSYAELNAPQQQTLQQITLNHCFAEVIVAGKVLAELYGQVPNCYLQVRQRGRGKNRTDLPFSADALPDKSARLVLDWITRQPDGTEFYDMLANLPIVNTFKAQGKRP